MGMDEKGVWIGGELGGGANRTRLDFWYLRNRYWLMQKVPGGTDGELVFGRQTE